MNNDKVVYQHSRASDGVVFYIGIGLPERPYVKINRNSLWNRTVKKHGLVVTILETGLSWEQACQREIALIAQHGRRNLGTGQLVNLTAGGEGKSGWVESAEQLTKRIAAVKASLTPESKVKRSAAAKAHNTNSTVVAKRNDPAAKAEFSAKRRAMWQDPEYRAKRAAAFANPETKARRSAAIKAAMATPESKAKRSAITAAQHAKRNQPTINLFEGVTP